MPTKAKSGAQRAHEHDAISMLTADHKRVKKLFSDFSDLRNEGSDEDKAAIVEQICSELKIHTVLEEEIFYPAVRKAISDADLMDEALVEHAGAKELISQLEQASVDDDLYDAKVTVLGEQIDHHVEEEEGEMFPKAKKANVDTGALGVAMFGRKAELMSEGGAGDDDAEEEEETADEEADDEEEVTADSRSRTARAAKR
jgi:hemerythrin superfamily protein